MAFLKGSIDVDNTDELQKTTDSIDHPMFDLDPIIVSHIKHIRKELSYPVTYHRQLSDVAIISFLYLKYVDEKYLDMVVFKENNDKPGQTHGFISSTEKQLNIVVKHMFKYVTLLLELNTNIEKIRENIDIVINSIINGNYYFNQNPFDVILPEKYNIEE